MEENLIQLGAVAVIFLWFIKEFFVYLKSKKDSTSADVLSGSGNALSVEILKELKLMNNNHLHSLQEEITVGNNRIVEAINTSSVKQIELLGEIKGQLSK